MVTLENKDAPEDKQDFPVGQLGPDCVALLHRNILAVQKNTGRQKLVQVFTGEPLRVLRLLSRAWSGDQQETHH